ncbi:hypothetical protein BIFCAT_01167 [Bifidobacterium catenulatum DSM 16992 = JCM 1194 = LMG 11043]|uniref:Uncharacterized protein n=1 Tax=Bifidobacterium catenulatum DSM 16992 = JCM 1194 = LMG 11043 TaxID=566552 RepID=B6XVD8_9BIFI|nr:hypothetical protein BIFCAT_01167 [Bifidobacterium catenulatum DSM 16992 = JCM 1194 = LMG 11043]
MIASRVLLAKNVLEYPIIFRIAQKRTSTFRQCNQSPCCLLAANGARMVNHDVRF